MHWKIVTLPKAREDYARTTEYLSGFYPSTPRKFHNAYLQALQRLKDNPHGCSVYYDCPEFRRIIIGKYTMFYIIDEERHEVHIHRILRSSWDLPHILRNAEEE